MSRFPEGSSFNPENFRAENTAEKPEQQIERVHVSLDLTVNRNLMKKRSGIHATSISEQHVEGELDSLLYALHTELERAEKSLEISKATPVPKRFDETAVDEERTQQFIEFNERSVTNLKLLIEKFTATVEQA